MDEVVAMTTYQDYVLIVTRNGRVFRISDVGYFEKIVCQEILELNIRDR